ncbi:MAG TPA: sterol desaturase family protein [Acidimicrobiales bacterium]|nr:sterol desaturase family protein [Acidimicrobiales bacterium]
MSFLLSVGALTVVYFMVGALERRPTLQFRRIPRPRPYLATDTAWYGLAVAASALSVFVFRPVLSRLAITPAATCVHAVPAAVQFVVALLVFDFLSFLVHRQLHRSSRLWEFHKVHHSTLHLDGFATTRAHMFENLIRFAPPQAVLFAAGMPAHVVALTVAVSAIYGVSNHSNLDITVPGFEVVLVTPRLHRRHHIPATTQMNYGAIFTIWDRMFGTLLRADTAADERYGVPGETDTYPQTFALAFRRPLTRPRRPAEPDATLDVAAEQASSGEFDPPVAAYPIR